MKRVALFGGTFDPIHRAHLFMAERAQARLELDRVIFIPCRRSPHKPEGTRAAAGHRIAMVRLAISRYEWAEVSSWEMEREGPSYSWQTATHFREIYPSTGTDLFWILGSDQWMLLERWERVDVLAHLVRFIVFPRFGQSPSPKEGIDAVFLPYGIDQSATQVRDRAAEGSVFEGEVSPEVAAYIRQNRLYSAE